MLFPYALSWHRAPTCAHARTRTHTHTHTRSTPTINIDEQESRRPSPPNNIFGTLNILMILRVVFCETWRSPLTVNMGRSVARTKKRACGGGELGKQSCFSTHETTSFDALAVTRNYLHSKGWPYRTPHIKEAMAKPLLEKCTRAEQSRQARQKSSPRH